MEDDSILREHIKTVQDKVPFYLIQPPNLYQINETPFVYDLHVDLITSLRRSGQLTELRAAREMMHSIYPLSPGTFSSEINLLS